MQLHRRCVEWKDIENAPERIKAVIAELNVAMELTFPHTTTYRKFYDTTTGMMTGRLEPNKELQVLLNSARKQLKKAEAKRARGKASLKQTKRKG